MTANYSTSLRAKRSNLIFQPKMGLRYFTRRIFPSLLQISHPLVEDRIVCMFLAMTINKLRHWFKPGFFQERADLGPLLRRAGFRHVTKTWLIPSQTDNSPKPVRGQGEKYLKVDGGFFQRMMMKIIISSSFHKSKFISAPFTFLAEL